ncbi:MAG TPA: YbhB/YbcL family Raf kinase inhibitor-like protein [Kofleriaceae bacterium]|nr:YbhB/YbcL family Raf kinase inhibitor-like protein [Kofleriaceae bacterium]
MQQPHSEPQPHELHVTSPSFRHGSAIPAEHTADGADLAPDLAWSKPPPGTQSFALLVDDPDAPDPAAPKRVFTHWIVTGIPAHVTALHGGRLPPGASYGTNDYGRRAWAGPNPPIGRHRYFFRVWALDIPLHAPGITRLELYAAIKGHVLAHGELVGTYGAMR